MQQLLQVNHPGKPLSDSYALIAYRTVPINLDGSKSTHSIFLGMRRSVGRLLALCERTPHLRKHSAEGGILEPSPSGFQALSSQIPRSSSHDHLGLLLCSYPSAETIAMGSLSLHQDIKAQTNGAVRQ